MKYCPYNITGQIPAYMSVQGLGGNFEFST